MKKTSDNQRRFARFRLSADAALLLLALAAAMALAALMQIGGSSVQAQQPLDTPTPTRTTTPTPAPTSETDPPTSPANFPLTERKTPPLGNLDSMLSQLVERVERGISTADGAAADAPISRGESVAVTFYTQGDAASLGDFLRANGGDPRNIGTGYVEAYVPVSLLVSASERQGVISVDAIVPPQPAYDAPLMLEGKRAPAGRGNVVSQGVRLHGANAWHDAGYTGAGVRVGVIDSGFAGISALMGSELPANVTARCYPDIGVATSDLADCESNQSRHGVSVAETLLDIAPGVDLYISNPRSWGDLKTAVEWMVSRDVDVINHSISWLWSGPPDGTSPYSISPVLSVDAAVSGGAIWTGSAGNEALSTWFGDFENPDSDIWLNFNGGFGSNSELPDATELNPVSLQAGEELTVALRWQGPWTNATIDLDLYLLDGSGTAVAGSLAFQDGAPAHRSLEWFSFTPVEAGNYYLAVDVYGGGTPPGWVQLQAFTSQELRHYTPGGSVTSPAESPNAGLLAVGAAHWWDVNTLARYSGRGPTPDGRIKPDITGAHCAATASDKRATLANGFSAWFCGTSQASPHVAGLAALVKQGFPDYAPQQIAGYLKTHAQPRGAKPNNDWGYGFARLPAPTGHPPPTPTPTATPTATATVAPTPASGELAGRVGELERQTGELLQQTGALQRLMESLQSLMRELTDRVAALEQGGGTAPTATATPTPTATPSPTPTSVSEPEPTPTAVGDACIQPIQPGAISGAWTTACLSANPPGAHTYYAKFYTFTLDARADVSVTLSAADSTYLYLLSGAGMDGDIEAQAGGDNTPTTTLSKTLEPGSYTIEATTFAYEITGDFALELAIAR